MFVQEKPFQEFFHYWLVRYKENVKPAGSRKLNDDICCLKNKVNTLVNCYSSLTYEINEKIAGLIITWIKVTDDSGVQRKTWMEALMTFTLKSYGLFL